MRRRRGSTGRGWRAAGSAPGDAGSRRRRRRGGPARSLGGGRGRGGSGPCSRPFWEGAGFPAPHPHGRPCPHRGWVSSAAARPCLASRHPPARTSAGGRRPGFRQQLPATHLPRPFFNLPGGGGFPPWSLPLSVLSAASPSGLTPRSFQDSQRPPHEPSQYPGDPGVSASESPPGWLQHGPPLLGQPRAQPPDRPSKATQPSWPGLSSV